MAFTKYIPTTRVSGEKILLRNNQLARFISKRNGVSAKAISQALILLGEGITDALAAGFDFQWKGMGTFETRELVPRIRYHRAKKEKYMSAPSVIVHFHKSPGLNNIVRDKASALLNDVVENPAVNPVGRK